MNGIFERRNRASETKDRTGAFLRTVFFTVAAAVFACARVTVPGNMDGMFPCIVFTAQAAEVTAEELEVTGLSWDDTDGTASWSKNENAYKYEVKLFRGSSCRTTKTTSEHYYEFGNYFSGSGDYYFQVRAVGQGNVKGDWVTSEYWYVSSSEAREIRNDYDDDDDCESDTWDSNHGPGVSGSYSNSTSGGPGVSSSSTVTAGEGVVTYGSTQVGAPTYGGNHWCQDNYGWWYQFANGSYPKNCWQQIDGKYYCFNESGYIRYGWISWNGKWYYCGTDGALMGNARTPDGYYVGSDGAWVQGQ